MYHPYFFWQSISFTPCILKKNKGITLRKKGGPSGANGLGARLLPLGFRVHLSVIPCGFRRWAKRGLGGVFSGLLPFFPYYKFDSTISPQLVHFASLHHMGGSPGELSEELVT